MDLNTLKETTSPNRQSVIVSQQEITSRKWKFNSLFKVIIGIVYGFFFGMLPGSFKFGQQRQVVEPDPYEISSVISLFFIGVLSIVLIFWLFKGDIKKRHPMSYVLVHLVNSVLLSVGILVAIILYPDFNNSSRYFVLGAAYAAWALVMMILVTVVIGKYKKQFPLSWSRNWYVVASFFFMGLIQAIIYVSKTILVEFNLPETAFIVQFGWLIALVISISIFGFGIAFIKRYRDVLLGEKTDNEIDAIQDWNSARILALVVSSIIIITYSVSLIWQDLTANTLAKWMSNPFYIELGIDLGLLIPYIILLTTIKIKNLRHSRNIFLNSRIFKAIDNGLLLDFLTWVVVVKSVLLQGLLASTPEFFGIDPKSPVKNIMLMTSFATIMIFYAFSILIQINIPNLRNTAISIATLFFAIVLAIFSIFFAVYLQSSELMSAYVFVLLPFIVLLGTSISLIIKISMIAKIFRSNNPKYAQAINKSQLLYEAENNTNNFIDNEEVLNSKTETVEVETIFDSESEQEINEI